MTSLLQCALSGSARGLLSPEVAPGGRLTALQAETSAAIQAQAREDTDQDDSQNHNNLFPPRVL